jgi:hypothetical protein
MISLTKNLLKTLKDIQKLPNFTKQLQTKQKFIMYLLKFNIKVNGVIGIYYHENITINHNKKGAVNTYVQHITKEKSNALEFFEKDEAERLAVFFKYDNYKVVKR